MNLSLAPEIQNYIESKVGTGRYATPEDVVADAIERLMLEEHSPVDPETLAAIERAEGEFDRGESRPFDEVAAELRKKYLVE